MLSRALMAIVNPRPDKALPVWLAAALVVGCIALAGNLE